MLILKYKKAREEEDLILPTKRDEDADYDLYASLDVIIDPGDCVCVSTNLQVEFPSGWEAKIEDKSGLAKRKIHILGGVIDSGYRGEILPMVLNLGDRRCVFLKGHKVAQMKIREKTPPVKWVLATSLEQSERGERGFGSQGQ